MHSTSLETQGALSKSCSVFSPLPDHIFLVNVLFLPPLPFSSDCFILLQYFPLLDFNVRIIALQARSNGRKAFLSQGLLFCFDSAVCLQIPDYLPSLTNTWAKLPHLYLFFLLKKEIVFSVHPKMYLVSILLQEYSRKFQKTELPQQSQAQWSVVFICHHRVTCLCLGHGLVVKCLHRAAVLSGAFPAKEGRECLMRKMWRMCKMCLMHLSDAFCAFDAQNVAEANENGG